MVKFSKGTGYMLISLVAFSIMHLLVKTIPGIPVVETIFFRSIFSLVVAYTLLRKARISPWGNRKGLLLLRGLAGVSSLCCFFYAIQHMPLASVITVTNLVPFFMLLLSLVFVGEKIAPVQWVFVGLAFLGVYLIKGFDARVETLYLIIAFVAAVFTALAHFLVRRLRDSEDENVIIFYFPLVSIPIVLGPMLYYWVSPSWHECMVLLGIGIFTHLGQVFLTRAYRFEEIGNMAGLYYIGLLLALGYGYFLFDETYNWVSLTGMLLVLSGVVFSRQ